MAIIEESTRRKPALLSSSSEWVCPKRSVIIIEEAVILPLPHSMSQTLGHRLRTVARLRQRKVPRFLVRLYSLDRGALLYITCLTHSTSSRGRPFLFCPPCPHKEVTPIVYIPHTRSYLILRVYILEKGVRPIIHKPMAYYTAVVRIIPKKILPGGGAGARCTTRMNE